MPESKDLSHAPISRDCETPLFKALTPAAGEMGRKRVATIGQPRGLLHNERTPPTL